MWRLRGDGGMYVNVSQAKTTEATLLIGIQFYFSFL